MAKRLQADNGDRVGANELSDKDRLDRLNAAIAAQLAIDRERDSFNAKLRERRNDEVMSIVRDVLGMPATTFGIFVRAAKLKADDKDEEAWDAFKTHCQIGFSALGIGEQLDMIDVINGGGSNERGGRGTKSTDDSIVDTLRQAKDKGLAAGAEGKALDTNPYPSGSKHHQNFAAGWHKSQAAIASKIKKGGGAEAVAH